jgi:hypothetical protein
VSYTFLRQVHEQWYTSAERDNAWRRDADLRPGLGFLVLVRV